MIEKSDSKWISLAAASILGQAPSPPRKSNHSKWAFLNAKGIYGQSISFRGAAHCKVIVESTVKPRTIDDE